MEHSLEAEVRNLLREELYPSAEIAGSLLLAKARGCEGTAGADECSVGCALGLYGDALYGTGEFKRAQSYYRQAVLRHRVSRAATSPRRGGYRSAAPSEDETESLLKFKEARCAVALEETGSAIATLEAIPCKWRSTAAHVMLGRLYKNTGLKKNAIAAFRAALKSNAYCLEAVEPLAQLGAAPGKELFAPQAAGDEDEPARASKETPRASSSSAMELDTGCSSSATGERRRSAAKAAPPDWLEPFVAAHGCMHRHEYAAAIGHFGSLEKCGFGRNLHGLLRVALCRMEMEDHVEASYSFHAARSLDPLNVDLMDYCCLLLKRRGALSELNLLAHELVSTNRRRPESWIAVSLYCEACGEREKALSFVEKAIALDSRCVLAFLLRGELLLAAGKADQAIVAYFQANNYAKCLASFTGLVTAYIAVRKFKEALATAKEAVAQHPKNALAVTLVGQVLATSPEGVAKAKKAFAKALELDAACTRAALQLVEVHIKQQDYAPCIKLLQNSLHARSRDVLHTKLADVYSLNDQHSDALACYHAAISLNPQSQDALRGIGRLEKLLHGVDPDQDDDDPDQTNAAGSDHGDAGFDAGSTAYI